MMFHANINQWLIADDNILYSKLKRKVDYQLLRRLLIIFAALQQPSWTLVIKLDFKFKIAVIFSLVLYHVCIQFSRIFVVFKTYLTRKRRKNDQCLTTKIPNFSSFYFQKKIQTFPVNIAGSRC